MGETAWADEIVTRARDALLPLADETRAAGALAYMKGVAPFLGLTASTRREALRAAWRELPTPTSAALAVAARALMHQREREFHYAAYDLLQWHQRVPDAGFVRQHGADLLLSTPWWDTVDGLVTAMVSPQMRRFRDDELMDSWSASGDRWLIRAALGHQRGWKSETDIPRVLGLCDAHWQDKEFFIAKAIGWALRDIARMDPSAVRRFLDEHPSTNRVAMREAERGLSAVPRSAPR